MYLFLPSYPPTSGMKQNHFTMQLSIENLMLTKSCIYSPKYWLRNYKNRGNNSKCNCVNQTFLPVAVFAVPMPVRYTTANGQHY